VRSRFPRKTFGYLLGEAGTRRPCDFILFEDNVRNAERWQSKFHAYGRYFVEHDDAGFVASAEESWRVQQEIWERGLEEVALFHTHQRHPANFSRIDYELHLAHSPTLWHLIISLRNPMRPRLRAFDVADGRVHELWLSAAAGTPKQQTVAGSARPENRRQPGSRRPPSCKSSDLRDLAEIAATSGAAAVTAAVDSEEARSRYRDHVADLMVRIPETSFSMGRSNGETSYCGEEPEHHVTIDAYEICRYPVTRELFSLMGSHGRTHQPTGGDRPITDLSWHEAVAFAAWMGCRLPTEAEWEYACGAGSNGDWCCVDEDALPQYAWFSENAGGEIQAVGRKRPNRLGLFDLHGNVWEWCFDVYSVDYYAQSPRRNPKNEQNQIAASALVDGSVTRVCRGGSIHALAEMCRTPYRQCEPPHFAAYDLGFRLAAAPETVGGDQCQS